MVPVAVWAGGLLALALTGRAATDQLAIAVRRFSPLAAACLLLVAGSGLVSAYVRLPGLGALVDTRYGQLVLLKTVVLGTLAAAGWWQRRAALPALLAGDRSRFTRTATVEVLLFAAAMGTAVALSRTPAPVQGEPAESIAQSLLGYPMPAAPDAGRLLGDWLPEPLFIAVVLAAAWCYLGAVGRLRRRGRALAGGAYGRAAGRRCGHHHRHRQRTGPVRATVVQRAPAPATAADHGRADPARARRPAHPGPAGVADQARIRAGRGRGSGCGRPGASRFGRLLTRPLVAAVLLAGTGFPLYFTGLYELTLRSHAAHLIMIGYFLAAGWLFFWVVLGVDPVPRRAGYPARLLAVALVVGSQVALGVVLARSGTLLAADWFTALARLWGDPPLVDQQTAGRLLWSLGNLPLLAVLAALAVSPTGAGSRRRHLPGKSRYRAPDNHSSSRKAWSRVGAGQHRATLSHQPFQRGAPRDPVQVAWRSVPDPFGGCRRWPLARRRPIVIAIAPKIVARRARLTH